MDRYAVLVWRHLSLSLSRVIRMMLLCNICAIFSIWTFDGWRDGDLGRQMKTREPHPRRTLLGQTLRAHSARSSPFLPKGGCWRRRLCTCSLYHAKQWCWCRPYISDKLADMWPGVIPHAYTTSVSGPTSDACLDRSDKAADGQACSPPPPASRSRACWSATARWTSAGGPVGRRAQC